MIERILFTLLLAAAGTIGYATYVTHQHVEILLGVQNALNAELSRVTEIVEHSERRDAEYACMQRQGEWHPEYGCALELLD